MDNVTVVSDVKKFNIPLVDIQKLYPNKRLVVGAAIAHPYFTASQKLLLLQRTETKEVDPSLYELPGGRNTPSDKTILDTLVREVMEETGLVVTNVLSEFESLEGESKGDEIKQFNFLVLVQGSEDIPPVVMTQPDKHQGFAWVAADDLEEYATTEDSKKLLADAFKALYNAPAVEPPRKIPLRTDSSISVVPSPM